ncbi:helix-turn-helix domain-containing protein [Anaeromyxobacter sp. SG66]|uniref:helix-turn-helix domain-containing protein n=1 Tax=Anaeromyxobacter sp. SG66 TaxID=2925410 RepID=UPI0027DF9254|nr:helix-turn-helix domain-containing protein [Anaeromyxobacter sp. SG66]
MPLGASSKDQLLTIREVTPILRMSTATVYKLVQSGELATIRVGNSIRIPRHLLPLETKP